MKRDYPRTIIVKDEHGPLLKEIQSFEVVTNISECSSDRYRLGKSIRLKERFRLNVSDERKGKDSFDSVLHDN